MTLITALVGGLACGYCPGRRPRAAAVWAVVLPMVLPVQTRLLVDPENGADWPVQAAILAVALGMIRLGATLRARRPRTA